MKNLTLSSLADLLSHILNQPVVDKTELSGAYDVQLNYGADRAGAEGVTAPDAAPAIFTAVREQLGLNLVAVKVPIEMIVIDKIDRVPSEN